MSISSQSSTNVILTPPSSSYLNPPPTMSLEQRVKKLVTDKLENIERDVKNCNEANDEKLKSMMNELQGMKSEENYGRDLESVKAYKKKKESLRKGIAKMLKHKAESGSIQQIEDLTKHRYEEFLKELEFLSNSALVEAKSLFDLPVAVGRHNLLDVSEADVKRFFNAIYLGFLFDRKGSRISLKDRQNQRDLVIKEVPGIQEEDVDAICHLGRLFVFKCKDSTRTHQEFLALSLEAYGSWVSNSSAKIDGLQISYTDCRRKLDKIIHSDHAKKKSLQLTEGSEILRRFDELGVTTDLALIESIENGGKVAENSQGDSSSQTQGDPSSQMGKGNLGEMYLEEQKVKQLVSNKSQFQAVEPDWIKFRGSLVEVVKNALQAECSRLAWECDCYSHFEKLIMLLYFCSVFDTSENESRAEIRSRKGDEQNSCLTYNLSLSFSNLQAVIMLKNCLCVCSIFDQTSHETDMLECIDSTNMYLSKSHEKVRNIFQTYHEVMEDVNLIMGSHFVTSIPIEKDRQMITASKGQVPSELDCKGSIEVETPRKEMFVAVGCEVRECVTPHWVDVITKATLRIWNGAVIRQLQKIKLIKYVKGKFHVIYEYYATNLESVLRKNIGTFFERIGESENYRFSDTFQGMISELLEGCESMRNGKMSVGENNFRRRVVFLKDHVDYYRAPKFISVEDQDPKNPYSSFLGLQKMFDTSHPKHALVSSFVGKIYDRKNAPDYIFLRNHPALWPRGYLLKFILWLTEKCDESKLYRKVDLDLERWIDKVTQDDFMNSFYEYSTKERECCYEGDNLLFKFQNFLRFLRNFYMHLDTLTVEDNESHKLLLEDKIHLLFPDFACTTYEQLHACYITFPARP